jgi:hypothetical protein
VNRSQEIAEIRTRTKSAFTGTYLTLLSIIQGVALTVLFTKVDSLVSDGSFHAPQVIGAIGTFLVIVAVWNQYQMGVMIYSWTAQLFDAFIPFTIGLCEFAMVSGIERGISMLLVANGLLLACGIAAFEYQYYQVRRNTYAGSFAHELNRTYRVVDSVMTAAAALVAFGSAWLVGRSSSPPAQIAGACIVVAIATAHLAREVLQWHAVQRRLSDAA